MGGAESARKIRTLAAIINETRKQEEEAIQKKGGTVVPEAAASPKSPPSNEVRTAQTARDEVHEEFVKKLSYGEKEAWEIHKKQTLLSDGGESQSRLHELTDEAHRKLHENKSRRIGRKAPVASGGHKKRLSKLL